MGNKVDIMEKKKDLTETVLLQSCRTHFTSNAKWFIWYGRCARPQSRELDRGDTALISLVEADTPPCIVTSSVTIAAPSSSWQAARQWSQQTHTCHESHFQHCVSKSSLAQI